MRSHLHLAFATLSLISMAHLGCAPAAPAESPESTGTAESTSEPPAQPQETAATEPESQADPGGEPKPKSSAQRLDDRVPDDYSLTNGDCNVLGKAYAEAIRTDQKAGIPDKLKDPQRAEVLQNIEEVARKMSGNWVESCQTSLVGQVVDPAALKCALKAPSVKEFDACLNSTLNMPPKK